MHLPENSYLQNGKYRIIRFINSGGFGCTYEAVHVLLDKRIAIKEFFIKDFCNRDEQTYHVKVGTESKKGLVSKLKKKFIDEARVLSCLHHSGIVNVNDVFEENSTAYYVMDYIEGCSLLDIIDRNGPLSEEHALGYIRQVCAALSYIHAHGRLHLDIKPGNIMINDDDNAILIDFGTSKQYDEMNGENTSTLMGMTPGYAPLEQLGRDVVKFLPATDIYAVGATFYKMLTGKTPLSATSIAGGEVLPPLPKHISVVTRKAIASAMNLSKIQRPQQVSDFLNLLNANKKTSSFNVIILNNKNIVLVIAIVITAALIILSVNNSGNNSEYLAITTDSIARFSDSIPLKSEISENLNKDSTDGFSSSTPLKSEISKNLNKDTDPYHLFKQAMQLKGKKKVNALLDLAKNGNAYTYFPLAKFYFSIKNIAEADRWLARSLYTVDHFEAKRLIEIKIHRGHIEDLPRTYENLKHRSHDRRDSMLLAKWDRLRGNTKGLKGQDSIYGLETNHQ